MSFLATSFRPLARGGWGGKAASHWRGCQATDTVLYGLTTLYPQTLKAGYWGQIGTVTMQKQGGVANYSITGVSRDSAGSPLATATVYLFTQQNAAWTQVASTVSDGSGNFSFTPMVPGPYWIVSYKAGSPDITGASVNTIQPA